MFVENLDTFIKWFRPFQETRAKWGIINSDIYNIDESESAINIKQKLKVILFSKKKKAFAKQDRNRE